MLKVSFNKINKNHIFMVTTMKFKWVNTIKNVTGVNSTGVHLK